MKKIGFLLGLLFPLFGLTQSEAEGVLPTDSLAVETETTTENTDTLQWVILQRNPELDELVAYYKKKDPPQITFHRGDFGRTLLSPWAGHTYYELDGQRVTRGGIEEYLGEVAPIAYKDFSRGRQLRRKSVKWLYIGLGGYLLTLTSNNQGIRNFGFGTLLVGGTVSLGCLIAGNSRQQRGINHYNLGF